MNIIIRNETENDHREVEVLTREAFWDVYRPGCDEHLLAHNLRTSPAFIPQLDFVAVSGDRIVGNIMYSKSKIVDGEGCIYEVIAFGPVSVLPSEQKKGIGSALTKRSLKQSAEMGYRAVVIFGNPAYYHRFGFKSSSEFGVSTADGQNFDAFMALELYPGALDGISGRYYDDPVFVVDKAELEEFEKSFPYKEKHVTDTQLK